MHCTLGSCGVCATCVYLACRLDYALLCCYTPLFNPSACSPLNRIAKIVLTTPTTTSNKCEDKLYFIILKAGESKDFFSKLMFKLHFS